MSLPLHTHAHIEGVRGVRILKVLEHSEALTSKYALEDILLWRAQGPGFAGSVEAAATEADQISIVDLRDPQVVKPGDVIRLRQGAGQISVLYRRGSRANTLFATERCNSRCLMCSQPPREDDDGWRVGELLKLVTLIDPNETQLGISGGEPTLLGEDLGRLIDACGLHLPDTTLHVLTNGRLFQQRRRAESLAGRRTDAVIWAVPLYGDVARDHDRVVDAEGAFAETLQGLYELGRLKARVELRVVLHRLTIPRLPQLASFIYRRLPFVEHVALMGLEPMGYAKRNREQLWIDPVDYLQPLLHAVFHLHNRGLPVSIFNLPLCILPPILRPFARQSISDWKNTLAPECAACAASAVCSGFFVSAGPTWRSRAVRPMTAEEMRHEMA